MSEWAEYLKDPRIEKDNSGTVNGEHGQLRQWIPVGEQKLIDGYDGEERAHVQSAKVKKGKKQDVEDLLSGAARLHDANLEVEEVVAPPSPPPKGSASSKGMATAAASSSQSVVAVSGSPSKLAAALAEDAGAATGSPAKIGNEKPEGSRGRGKQ
eukprot:332811-Alexandrium_andersonii.AAC.1